jgi:antitoxin ParD1/3/4
MNVSLTRELEKMVSRRVASGRYASASEVIREALRLLDERDRLSELRRDVRAGRARLKGTAKTSAAASSRAK